MDTSFHIDVTSNSNGEDNNNSVNSSAGNATTIAILKASNWTSECRDKFDPKQTTTDPCQVTGHATSISTVTAPTREATNVRESDRKGEQPKLDLGFHVVLPIAVLLVIAALVASMLVAYRWHKKQAANQALAPGQNPYPSYPHHPLSGYPLQMYDLPPYPMWGNWGSAMVCVCDGVCVCVCEREREGGGGRDRESAFVWERVCTAWVCVCVGERERGREGVRIHVHLCVWESVGERGVCACVCVHAHTFAIVHSNSFILKQTLVFYKGK